MKLYHYTRRTSIPNILREGLSRGYIPIDRTHGINAVCLTVRPELPHRVLETGDRHPAYCKRSRITVEIDPADPALLRWKLFPERFRTTGRDFRDLNRGVEGQPVYDWYIYLGTIPPDRFTELPDFVTGLPIPREEWPAVSKESGVETFLPNDLKVVSLSEALRFPPERLAA